MKGINSYIVRLESHLTNEIILPNGVKLYKDPYWDLGRNAVTVGEVVSVPDGVTAGVKVGDLLSFEHVITMQNEKDEMSKFCIDKSKKLYRVPLNLAIAYKSNEEWHLTGNYNLLKPVKVEKKAEKSNLILVNQNMEYEGYRENIGEAWKLLPDIEAEVGNMLFVAKNTEYKISLESEPYYAVRSENIIGVLI
jgi:hypothetical protein